MVIIIILSIPKMDANGTNYFTDGIGTYVDKTLRDLPKDEFTF